MLKWDANEIHICNQLLYQLMANTVRLFVFLGLFLGGLCLNSTFHQYKHDVSTGAMCLDGSESFLYVDQGAGVNETKVLIFFEGAGYCQGEDLSATLENCYLRSLTEKGSSKRWPKTVNMQNVSILSANKTLNPVFYDWTKVYIPSCDGCAHQGSRQAPVTFRSTDMYFRGTNNTLQHLKYLNDTYQLYLRPMIVVSGTSTGGLAAMLWANFIQESAIKSRVYVVADSAVEVLDVRSALTNQTVALQKMANLFKLVNTEVDIPNKECIKDYPGQRECLMAGVLAHYIKTPVYLIQSQYDLWAIHNILELDCVPNGQAVSMLDCNITAQRAIKNYRNKSLQAFQNFTKYPNAGVFAISCIQHVFTLDDTFNSPFYQVPVDSKHNIAKALGAYFSNPASSDNIRIDKLEWPLNYPCSGTI